MSGAWEWKDDFGWKAYDQATCTNIDSNLQKGVTQTNVKFGSTNYVIDTSKMVQTNSKTGFSRKIRQKGAVTASPAASGLVWEWLDESGWRPYDAATCALISNNINKGIQQHKYSFGKSQYVIDTTTMTQTNTATGFVRQVRQAGTVGGIPFFGFEDTIDEPDEPVERIVIRPPKTYAPFDVKKVPFIVAKKEDLESGDVCSVCMFEFEDNSQTIEYKTKDGTVKTVEAAPTDEVIVRMEDCTGHWFHKDCVEGALNHTPKCPVCGIPYGELHGSMPDGTMTLERQPPGCVPLGGGDDSVGTWVIEYHFPSGTQGPEHPSPGMEFHGTSRTAYLPDNEDGREVLELLKRAFLARQSFRVGQSITTGADNCVVWNGIHHKTDTHGSPWGYPDPSYFDRVKEELAAFGIRSEPKDGAAAK